MKGIYTSISAKNAGKTVSVLNHWAIFPVPIKKKTIKVHNISF